RGGGPTNLVSMRWYGHVLDRMGSKPDDFRQNNLSVLTFNYDRSFEQFLFLALQDRYGIGPTDAANLLDEMPVVHLHGSLGSLPPLAPGYGCPRCLVLRNQWGARKILKSALCR